MSQGTGGKETTSRSEVNAKASISLAVEEEGSKGSKYTVTTFQEHRQDLQPTGFYAQVYCAGLARDITLNNQETTIVHLKQIAASLNDKDAQDFFVHFTSQLFSSFSHLSKNSSKPNKDKKRAILFALDSTLDLIAPRPDFPSTLCQALRLTAQQHPLQDNPQHGSSSSVKVLLEHLLQSAHSKSALSLRTIIYISAAISAGWQETIFHTDSKASKEQELNLVEFSLRALITSIEESDNLDLIPISLRQVILLVLLSSEAVNTRVNNTNNNHLLSASAIVSRLTMSTGNSSTSSLSGMAQRLSPATSNGGIGVTNLLADLGPTCTLSKAILRETLREITKSLPNDPRSSEGVSLEEEIMARLIYFFSVRGSRKRYGNANKDENGLLVPDFTSESDFESEGGTGWDLNVVAEVLREDYSNLDYDLIAKCCDFEDFLIKDAAHLGAFLSLYQCAAKKLFPLKIICSKWKNKSGQLSFLEQALAVKPSVFTFPLDDEETADASTAGDVSNSSCLNPQGWASSNVLQLLLQLSDDPTVSRRVRDLFVRGLLSCPEVLICAIVRRLQNNTGGQQCNSNEGMQLKGELMRELIPLFFKQNAQHRVRNGPSAIRRLWSIAPNTVAAACIEAWRSTVNETSHNRIQTIIHVISIIRLLPNPENATVTILNGNKDYDFSIAVALIMADHDLLQLRSWFKERSSSANGSLFLLGLISYVGRNQQTALSRASGSNNNSGKSASLLSIENLTVCLQFLQSLDSSVMGQEVPKSSGVDSLNSCLTFGDAIKALTETCLTVHPSVTSLLSSTQRGQSNSQNSPDDIEEMANSYFQKIYTSEQSIDEVVNMLKKFKTSGNAKENDIFACMIHNLFDEYRFFSKYPEKELRITGILFGKLIRHQLVSSITLGIALRYVLEALRKPPGGPVAATTLNSGKMFRFGMFALEQFKERLHEWPQYCSHIVQIPHLKEGYAALIAEIEGAMVENRNKNSSGESMASGLSESNSMMSGKKTDGVPDSVDIRLDGAKQSKPNGLVRGAPSPSNLTMTSGAITTVPFAKKVAKFGPKLGKAVNNKLEEVPHDAPPETVLDTVQFIINNVTISNVEEKALKLKGSLEAKYFGWLGHYLVVKRISTQPNFHSTYLVFLEHLGGEYGKGLIDAILSSVYFNVGKLLRSPKITTSTSERSLLKNLGSWLGQITLARNRPILQITLDCKELLFQGYETGMLIAVTPFVAKILEGAKTSVVFRPPNPWLMGLLSVFRALYGVDDLKMNIKFEVEVLCKNLGVKLEDIPLRAEDLAKRIPPVKTRNPDFNMKSSMGQQSTVSTANTAFQQPSTGSTVSDGNGVSSIAGTGIALPTSSLQVGSPTSSVSGSNDQHQTVIPNLASYVTINNSLNQLFQQLSAKSVVANINHATLTRNVPIAVDRAIREIIQPVVERSVTIACITTKEIVTKDFAMESDEVKMRKAAQLMVANLAGSLALVTCREPLRASVSSHLRQLLVASAAGTGTGTGGNESSNIKLSDQEQNIIDQCVTLCSQDNLELGCMLIEKAATEKAVRDIDDNLATSLNARKKHREQTGQPYYDMSIFGNGSQRYPASLPEPLRPKPGGLRPEQLLVYDSFQRIPRPIIPSSQQSSNSAPTSPAPPTPGVMKGPKLSVDALSSMAVKLENLVTSLLATAGPRAPEITLGMLPDDHEIKQLLLSSNQMTSSVSSLSTSEVDSVLAFAQNIFKRLYELRLSEPLRLEAFVELLESLRSCCSQLRQNIGTWATYAPTGTDSKRKLHRTVLLLLLRSNLFPVEELDNYLYKSIERGRNIVWLDFTLAFLRTAVIEKIVNPNELPKVMDVFTGLSKSATQNSQIPQLFRLIQEYGGVTNTTDSKGRDKVDSALDLNTDTPGRLTHEQSSSISAVSLSNLAGATKRAAEIMEKTSREDPPSFKQQVLVMLDEWLKLSNDSNEKSLQYLQLLQHHHSIGSNEENTERFFRLCTELAVGTALKTSSGDDNKSNALNYEVIDGYARLVTMLIKNVNKGGSSEQVSGYKVSLLNQILGVTIRTMMANYEKSKSDHTSKWDQRPWFRLMLNLVIDLNSPDQTLDPIGFGILSVFGSAFHVIQPLVIPGFAFAWLELISHRMFLSNLLLSRGQKGWTIAHQLLIDLFLFLEPHLRKTELTDAIKHLYKGTLRVLLVLLHDFPAFLAGYHLSFCNVIPENCVQLRNLVLSAFPRGMVLPDPFTPNLKIDLLPEISTSPMVLSNVTGPLTAIHADLETFLKSRQPLDFLQNMLPRLYKEGTQQVDPPRVNALVLFVGMQAIVNRQDEQISQSLPRSTEMSILQKLMDFDDEGRYICLNAIANQLRYPSSHTHFFSCVMLFLFGESKDECVKEQVTRVLLERLIVHRPHPWGLLITFIELIKNQRYQFWSHPFTRCATEIEKVFESVARSCMAPGSQRPTTITSGDITQQGMS